VHKTAKYPSGTRASSPPILRERFGELATDFHFIFRLAINLSMLLRYANAHIQPHGILHKSFKPAESPISNP